jgi:hypothetical protein
MKIEDRQTIKEALSFIENFGEHRHLSKFPHECRHCILIIKLKNLLDSEAVPPQGGAIGLVYPILRVSPALR